MRRIIYMTALMTGPVLTCAAGEPPFHFEVTEGQNLNYFLRDGSVAAHLLLRAGPQPRLLVAFPAGNSGVGVWFGADQPAAHQPSAQQAAGQQATTQPAAAQPALAAQATSQSVGAQPALVAQAASQSVGVHLAPAAQATTQPAAGHPAPAEQATSQPAGAQPVPAEQATSQPAAGHPAPAAQATSQPAAGQPNSPAQAPSRQAAGQHGPASQSAGLAPDAQRASAREADARGATAHAAASEPTRAPGVGTPQWVINTPPAAKVDRDASGRTLYGITFDASIATNTLVTKQAVLSSIRVLRDYQALGTVPAEVTTRVQLSGKTLTWSRNRLDGAPGYRLSLEVTSGMVTADGRITAGSNGRIQLHVTALSGEQPLTPLAGKSLLRSPQVGDERAADTLTYLSYQEKFLAGSWRFDTYFGRDTLMSLRLLMPALAPEAIEAGLRSVLARLSSDGQVAHEEGIGEFAVLDHKKENGSLSDRPVYDYAMIDGNYLLAPVLVHYLLDDPMGATRAVAYLQSNVALDTETESGGGNAKAAGGHAITGGGDTKAGQALIRNLRLLVTNATRFSADSRYNNLISLKPGHKTGQWRDSQDGIGGGRYPYDVNAILVPAALEATARLLAAGLLDPFVTADDRKLLGNAAAAAKIWRARAPGLFNTTIDSEHARAAISSYASQIGVPAAAALSSLGSSSVSFHALALNAAGKPVSIINSDETAELLFGTPDPAVLDSAVQTVMRPFPLGLLTDAGMVVANPVFADEAQKALFTNHAYHGTVIWSWQQAQFASGLERQLARKDLPAPVRQHLLTTQRALWRVIGAARSMQNSELWSWSFAGGRYQVTAFGASGADADESNAAQLWSSVYLAVTPPYHER